MDRNELAEWLEWLVQDEFHNLSAPKMERLRQAAAALRESEELRRDSERYRWLRDSDGDVGWRILKFSNPADPAIDAAIDSARGVDKTERGAG